MIVAATSNVTRANAVIIEGFFALMWFSWGQEQPAAWESTASTIGAILAIVVAVGGIVLAGRARREPAPAAAASIGKRYGITVGTELASAAGGAAILAVAGHGELIAAWVCFVVGAHFLPLDRVFPGLGLAGLATAVVGVAVTAFIVSAATSTPSSAVTGLGAGACLLLHAAALVLLAGREPGVRRGE
jgi:hypothetical protein